jgi:hypothetical protein
MQCVEEIMPQVSRFPEFFLMLLVDCHVIIAEYLVSCLLLYVEIRAYSK